jgi:hypothetical protein
MTCNFTCPACGHENTFNPEEHELIVRFKPDEEGTFGEFRYRRVRCSNCGREEDVLIERR